MSDDKIPVHYVCTYARARELIAGTEQFWVSNCGCRESNEKGCKRSRLDVCLMFREDENSSGTGKRKSTRADAESIMKEAEEKRLVARPFRNEARDQTTGICFCCDDCCGYFLDKDEKGNPKYTCDKGEMIETTAMADCTHCGECEPVCFFNARKMEGDKLTLDRELCFGCGLCVDACPATCISMVPRAPAGCKA
jgi:ferredoxin